MIGLLGHVLINGVNTLLKRGLERAYQETLQQYGGVKGKIDFQHLINKNLFRQGKAACRFDEFEVDILSNQLLKATLGRIRKLKGLGHDLQQDTASLYKQLAGISDIHPSLSLFSLVKIHRNNTFYDFLLKVCKLIIENSVLDESSGEYQFKNFLGSEKQMAALFESFVRNFYKRQQSIYRVRIEDIPWNAIPLNKSSASLLPKMQADISPESANRKIIIDTKYYLNALTSRYESEKLNSGNLYQQFSYLKNIETKRDHPLNSNCEGVLLYPTVRYSLNETYQLGNHTLRIRTVDLNQEWAAIKTELLRICLD